MQQEDGEPRLQTALLCGVIMVIVLGELVFGPWSAKAWVPLDVFLALASFAAAAMVLRTERLPAAVWVALAFLGGAVLAGVLLPLPNPIWLVTHALVLVAGVAAGALLLRAS